MSLPRNVRSHREEKDNIENPSIIFITFHVDHGVLVWRLDERIVHEERIVLILQFHPNPHKRMPWLMKSYRPYTIKGAKLMVSLRIRDYADDAVTDGDDDDADCIQRPNRGPKWADCPWWSSGPEGGSAVEPPELPIDQHHWIDNSPYWCRPWPAVSRWADPRGSCTTSETCATCTRPASSLRTQ